jgi:hypothetical protein
VCFNAIFYPAFVDLFVANTINADVGAFFAAMQRGISFRPPVRVRTHKRSRLSWIAIGLGLAPTFSGNYAYALRSELVRAHMTNREAATTASHLRTWFTSPFSDLNFLKGGFNEWSK